MLPGPRRLRRSADFSEVVRRGSRAGRSTVVVHLLIADDRRVSSALPVQPPRAGFVVNRAVGPATTRNRVKRQLRHLVAPALTRCPPGTRLVVRALPSAARADTRTLRRDVTGGLNNALQRAHRKKRSVA